MGREKRCEGGLDVTEIASEHGTAVSLKSRSVDSKGQVFLSLICSSCGAEVCVYVELQHQQRHGCVITIRGSRAAGIRPQLSQQHHIWGGDAKNLRAAAMSTSPILQ